MGEEHAGSGSENPDLPFSTLGRYGGGVPTDLINRRLPVVVVGTLDKIVAKQANAHYTPEATTWVKIKNREYSQAVGRDDFFDRERQLSPRSR